ncbi:MAG: hypothetical protein R3D00_22355 [Bacteroidia bacterium]
MNDKYENWIYDPQLTHGNSVLICDFDVIQMETKGVEVSFPVYDDVNEFERQYLTEYLSIETRRSENLKIGYYVTRLHEGILYGLSYAYDILLKYSGETPKGFRILIKRYPKGTGITHDLLAFLFANLFWEKVNFTPPFQIKQDTERQRFVFPEAKERVPLGIICLAEIYKYFTNGTPEDVASIYSYYKDIENSYFAE